MIPMLTAAAALLLASGTAATTITATPATLAADLARAASGDTVQLAPGTYPATKVHDRHWSPPVTVEAGTATLAGIRLEKVSGLTWHGGRFDGGDTQRNGINVDTADHLVIDGVTFSHFSRNGIGLGRVSDARVTNNTITDSGSDGIDVALSRRIVLDHNRCVDTHPTEGAHPDCIQLWSRPTDLPTADITITNNEATGDTQGFTAFNHVRNGVDDGGFDRIVIENNHAKVSTYHGISIYSCRGCTVRHNRVETAAGRDGRVRAWIKAVDSPDLAACDNKAEGAATVGGGRCPEPAS